MRRRRNAREQQFDELYRDTYQQVYAYCLRRVDRRGDVDDVVSEVYASVWRRLDDALQADSPLAWIYGIAYRLLGNHHRGRARATRLQHRLAQQPVDSGDVDPADAATHREQLDVARDAFGLLQPLDRELLQLAVWEQLTHAEIGEVLGFDPSLVRSRLYRARQRFRTGLDDLEARDGHGQPDTKELKSGTGNERTMRRSVGGRREGTSP